jgi:hypothetical protein
MKVRCTRLLDSHDMPTDKSPWLTIGGIYHVLGIWMEPGSHRFRLLGDQRPPGLHSADAFELVTAVIPSTWIVRSPKVGCFALEPAEWGRPGFWESYFDGDTEAQQTFQTELRKIVESDP